VSVSFEKMSVIMLLFVDIRIKTSKNGISILLLFTVKRIWSFKELSSVWKFSTGMSAYRQKRGTVMGNKMAPIYATLVLGYLEHILYEQLLNNYGQEFASYVRQNWKRFLDDCFIIWNADIPVENFQSRISQLLCVCDRYNSRIQIKRNVYFNMFRVTGSEIKIHMGVSIFRENVRLRELRLYLKNQQYPEEIVEHGIQIYRWKKDRYIRNCENKYM
jgi:hypothetical protein